MHPFRFPVSESQKRIRKFFRVTATLLIVGTLMPALIAVSDTRGRLDAPMTLPADLFLRIEKQYLELLNALHLDQQGRILGAEKRLENLRQRSDRMEGNRAGEKPLVVQISEVERDLFELQRYLKELEEEICTQTDKLKLLDPAAESNGAGKNADDQRTEKDGAAGTEDSRARTIE